MSILRFLHDVRYVIAFYVIGDLLTTYYATTTTHLGYEGNPLLSSSPLLYVLYFKLAFLIYLSICFRFGSSKAWNCTRHVVTMFGVFIVANNLYVSQTGLSFLQVAGVI